jgi:hypothetical protein
MKTNPAARRVWKPRLSLACLAIAATPNPWDRDVALKQALGVPRAVFERPAELFK